MKLVLLDLQANQLSFAFFYFCSFFIHFSFFMFLRLGGHALVSLPPSIVDLFIADNPALTALPSPVDSSSSSTSSTVVVAPPPASIRIIDASRW